MSTTSFGNSTSPVLLALLAQVKLQYMYKSWEDARVYIRKCAPMRSEAVNFATGFASLIRGKPVSSQLNSVFHRSRD